MTDDFRDFLIKFKDDIEKKYYCCIYIYSGRRKHGIVRFLINNGKKDIHDWIASDEIIKVGSSFTAYEKALRSIVGNVLFERIYAYSFPKFQWRIIRLDESADDVLRKPISLTFRGVMLVYKNKNISFCNVKSVKQCLNEVLETSKLLNRKHFCLYYRGQLAYWDLKPSLFREKEWVENESVLNAQIVCDRPDDFKDCKTTFDKLVKLKHYNQPSRLLDLTSNPLVGLFFACDCMISEGRNNTIGMVVEAFSEIAKEKIAVSSDTVILLSALSNTKRYSGVCGIPDECKKTPGDVLPYKDAEHKSKCNNCNLLENLNNNHSKEEIENNPLVKDEFRNELIHQCKRESQSELYWNDLCYGEINQCILVKPPLNNDRIIQQQGCFIMCGSNPENLDEPPKNLKNFFTMPNIVFEKGKIPKWTFFYILPRYLDLLLEELKLLGIDKYYIYPDLEKDIEVRKYSLIKEK